MNQQEAERWREPERPLKKESAQVTKIKDLLQTVRVLLADAERHIGAGGIVKANNTAMSLKNTASELVKLTYVLAFPDKCPHLGDKTDVQGGGQSCNSCGDFC